MKTPSRFIHLSFVLIMTTSSGLAWGRPGRSAADVSVSGGIAMPSASTSVFTNAAGLADQRSTQFLLQAGAPKLWESPTYRAGLQTGNGQFGVAAGIENRHGEGRDPLNVFYGLAVGVRSFSLGVGAKTGVSGSSGTSIQAGLLLKPTPAMQLGVTAVGLNGGPSEYGLGAGFDLSSGLSFVIDSAVDDELSGLELKPGIKIGNTSAALTLSYATGGRQQFSGGFTVGGSIKVTSASTLEVYYNHGHDLAEYYAALSLGF